MGTPRYMSPEQVTGLAPTDHRADIWAMSVILYRALTGQYPFGGRTVAEVATEIYEGRYTKASEVAPELPPGIDAVFEQAFAKDVEARFQSGKALTRALASVAEEEKVLLRRGGGMLAAQSLNGDEHGPRTRPWPTLPTMPRQSLAPQSRPITQ